MYQMPVLHVPAADVSEALHVPAADVSEALHVPTAGVSEYRCFLKILRS